jgi:multidrug efflux pump subunit AcrA (membrane-fusion protein)
MKRILIIGGVVLAVIALIVFNKMTSRKVNSNSFAEVKKGVFEITVVNSGELMAENSIDIKGPEIPMGSMGGGPGGGFNMRAMDLKIQDIVPEGTIVNKGDYIAQLDRSSYSNTLKDELEKLKTAQENVDMKILDTAVVLTDQRNEIKNQTYVVEEASITLEQDKYEPPATIRQAKTKLDEAQRALLQKKKAYSLLVAETMAELRSLKLKLDKENRLVSGLQDFLTKFTITAPNSGMVIYKKDRNGNKRKAGSTINPFDRVIATLPDLTSMISKVYVNEIDINKIKPGLKVSINVDAFPKKAYSGSVFTIANIGEVLPNSDSKMFEVQVKLDGSDTDLRPTMTTGNKIIIRTYNDAIYVPTECVHTGTDGIQFVYGKNNTKNIVVLGEANDKNVIIEKGLKEGTMIYLIQPQEPENFKVVGDNLVSEIKNQK